VVAEGSDLAGGEVVKGDEPTGMQRIAAMVPADLAERLERYAELHDRTLSAEVRRAIRQYLDAGKDEAA
jgi:hypothetical protein